MSDTTIVAYLHDGTLEGFFSAIFDAYTLPQKPDVISASDCYQDRLEQITIYVQTEERKYERVYTGIKKHLGMDGYRKVKAVFLSCEPDKDTQLYRYLVYGFKVGRKVHVDIAHEAVNPIERHYRDVWMETRRIMQFARFARMDNGVYYAKVNPKHNVLPLVMDHFARRFNIQPFIIYDEIHQLAGIYDMKQWRLQYVENFSAPDCAADDRRYQKLWKTFYDSIAIKERVNHRQRRTFMPMRFWSNLTEMTYMDRESDTAQQALDAGSILAREAYSLVSPSSNDTL